MIPVNHHVKKKNFKTVQEIVNSQDFVVVGAFLSCLEKLYNKTIVDY